MTNWSRRELLQAMAVAAAATAVSARAATTDPSKQPEFRVRTITAGVDVRDFRDLRPFDVALDALDRARAAFESAGYEVQTVRIATSPAVAAMNHRERVEALDALRALDDLLRSRGAIGSIGPCAVAGARDANVATWVTEFLRSTSRLATSISVASAASGIEDGCARMAAEAIAAIAASTQEGAGNFRFAAAACIPAGTPFFPVAYHEGAPALAVGLELPGVVQAAVAGAATAQEATAQLRRRLNRALAPVERIAARLAEESNHIYLGIDPSPAPALDRSIGAALESFTRQPFGGSGTVDACAAVTTALRGLDVKVCGYAGLMLPVVEDPVLAQRAIEGRYGVRDLLLFSSVCGTGLDLVPLPGDTPVDTIERIIKDVAALSYRWSKPLAARLLLVPGKKAGEMAAFSDPLLTSCRVMSAD